MCNKIIFKSMTLMQKIKFFVYTGLWPKEVVMPKTNNQDFYGIPRVTVLKDWVEIEPHEGAPMIYIDEYLDPTELQETPPINSNMSDVYHTWPRGVGKKLLLDELNEEYLDPTEITHYE